MVEHRKRLQRTELWQSRIRQPLRQVDRLHPSYAQSDLVGTGKMVRGQAQRHGTAVINARRRYVPNVLCIATCCTSDNREGRRTKRNEGEGETHRPPLFYAAITTCLSRQAIASLRRRQQPLIRNPQMTSRTTMLRRITADKNDRTAGWRMGSGEQKQKSDFTPNLPQPPLYRSTEKQARSQYDF